MSDRQTLAGIGVTWVRLDSRPRTCRAPEAAWKPIVRATMAWARGIGPTPCGVLYDAISNANPALLPGGK